MCDADLSYLLNVFLWKFYSEINQLNAVTTLPNLSLNVKSSACGLLVDLLLKGFFKFLPLETELNSHELLCRHGGTRPSSIIPDSVTSATLGTLIWEN